MDNMQIAYECTESIRIARLGYLLANGLLDQTTANDIIHECQPLAGWFPLETIDVDSVIETAADRWANPEDQIKPLAEEACRRIWNKWDSTGDVPSVAVDWAIDLVSEYAEDEGIILVHVEEVADAV